MEMKRKYCHIIVKLICVIVLLIIFIIILPTKERVVEVIKEIEVEKEVIIEVEKEPTYKYNVTSVEREMLARLVYLEGNIESIECQAAIISVVINRWQNGKWGNTLRDVIYYQNQFTPSDLIYKTTPTEINYKAVDFVLQNGCTIPPYCMYFRADYHFDWKGYKPYTKIDTTYFGYFEVDKNEK